MGRESLNAVAGARGAAVQAERRPTERRAMSPAGWSSASHFPGVVSIFSAKLGKIRLYFTGRQESEDMLVKALCKRPFAHDK